MRNSRINLHGRHLGRLLLVLACLALPSLPVQGQEQTGTARDDHTQQSGTAASSERTRGQTERTAPDSDTRSGRAARQDPDYAGEYDQDPDYAGQYDDSREFAEDYNENQEYAGDYDETGEYAGDYNERPAYAGEYDDSPTYAGQYDGSRMAGRRPDRNGWYDPSDWYEEDNEIEYLDHYYGDYYDNDDADIYDEVRRDMLDEEDLNGYNEDYGDYYEGYGDIYDEEIGTLERRAEGEYFQGLFDVAPYPEYSDNDLAVRADAPWGGGVYEYYTDDWFEDESDFDTWYNEPEEE